MAPRGAASCSWPSPGSWPAGPCLSGCWPRPACGWAMRCLCVRWVWGEATTFGAACQTPQDSPVGVSVATLAALVRTRGLSLHWPPCPGPPGPAPASGQCGCVPTGSGPLGTPRLSLLGASFLFHLLGSPLRCESRTDPLSPSSVRPWPALDAWHPVWKQIAVWAAWMCATCSG